MSKYCRNHGDQAELQNSRTLTKTIGIDFFGTDQATQNTVQSINMTYAEANDPRLVAVIAIAQETVNYSVMVGFKLDDSKEMLVAWTTTPWTLPSNLACAVHPDLDYVTVEGMCLFTLHELFLHAFFADGATGNHYILMELRLSELYKKSDEYRVLRKFKGVELKGKTYEPLFPYFAHLKKEIGAFRVLTGTFVTTDQGTGVVHQAPYFGEVGNTCPITVLF
jgi:isoleucyl-tRNA synthetase